jgi:hypothetical protein
MRRARLITFMALGVCLVVGLLPAAAGASAPPSAAELQALLGSGQAAPDTVVYLSGSPAERGRAYGATARDAIGANLAQFRADVLAGGRSYGALCARARHLARFLPRREREELRAMAVAAGVGYAELLALNRFASTVDGTTATSSGETGTSSCTQFIIAGARSADGRTIASKNRDASKPQVLVISAATRTTNAFVAVQKAGEWGISFGLNDKGLCVGNNWLPTPGTYAAGLGEEEINRRVVESCATVDAAIVFVDDVPKHHGTCVMVADKTGGAFIEAVYTGLTPDIVAKKVTNGALVHTNHYMYEPYKSWVIDDGFGYWWTPGVARYDRAMELLAADPQPLTHVDVQGFCRDLVDFGDGQPALVEALHPEVPAGCWANGGAGYSICNSATRASGVFVIDKVCPSQLSTMWMSIYNPAWCPYTPVHNAVLSQIPTATTGMQPYVTTAVWDYCWTLQKGPYDWGHFIPTFEAWEASTARPANAAAEAAARSLLARKKTADATRTLTQSDVGVSASAYDLLRTLK